MERKLCLCMSEIVSLKDTYVLTKEKKHTSAIVHEHNRIEHYILSLQLTPQLLESYSYDLIKSI